jgi:TPR repeat protein
MRGPLLALLGALVAVVVAAAAAWGFIAWRASEQERALTAHAGACYGGAQAACDRLRDACGKRSGIACAKLAARYLEDKGVPADPEEGLRLLDEACRTHHAESCLGSARLRRADPRRRADPGELGKAAEALRKACAAGLAEACGMAE